MADYHAQIMRIPKLTDSMLILAVGFGVTGLSHVIADTVSSYIQGITGGAPDHPTYQQVAYKQTTHYEAIRIVYDPKVVTYERLLQVFWHNIDPTQGDGQFCDKGPQYRSAVFTSDPTEKATAERTKGAVGERLGQQVVTQVLDAATFWVAEEYHQDFYIKNPSRYTSYRAGCGRDRRLQQLWAGDAGH